MLFTHLPLSDIKNNGLAETRFSAYSFNEISKC